MSKLLIAVTMFFCSCFVAFGMTAEKERTLPMEHGLSDVSSLESDFSAVLSFSAFHRQNIDKIVYNVFSVRKDMPAVKPGTPEESIPQAKSVEWKEELVMDFSKYRRDIRSADRDMAMYQQSTKRIDTGIYYVSLDSCWNVIEKSSKLDFNNIPRSALEKTKIVEMIRWDDGREYMANDSSSFSALAIFPSFPVAKGFEWEHKEKVDTLQFPTGELVSNYKVINTYIKNSHRIVRIRVNSQYSVYSSSMDRRLNIPPANCKKSTIFDLNIDLGVIENAFSRETVLQPSRSSPETSALGDRKAMVTTMKKIVEML